MAVVRALPGREALPPAGECPHTEDLHRLSIQVAHLTLIVAHLAGVPAEATPPVGPPVLTVLRGGRAS
jgi:hypothetical protein